jgi:hypothetical protein
VKACLFSCAARLRSYNNIIDKYGESVIDATSLSAYRTDIRRSLSASGSCLQPLNQHV